jgi:hypothetical protein
MSLLRPISAADRSHLSAVIDDLLFLDDWDRGQFPRLDAFFRARQIRRAWAAVARGRATALRNSKGPPPPGHWTAHWLAPFASPGESYGAARAPATAVCSSLSSTAPGIILPPIT